MGGEETAIVNEALGDVVLETPSRAVLHAVCEYEFILRTEDRSSKQRMNSSDDSTEQGILAITQIYQRDNRTDH